MIEINEKAIEKAIEKARQTKPLVKVIEFRHYQVTNRETGAKYEVSFTKVGGKKFADCTCKAGQAGKFLCYHIAASIGIHIILAEQTIKA
jgi:hypothetical protein